MLLGKGYTNGSMEQSREKQTHINSQLVFERAKAMEWRKDSPRWSFQVMVLEQPDILMQLKKKKNEYRLLQGTEPDYWVLGEEMLDEMPEWGLQGRSKEFFLEISKNKQSCLIGKVSRAC